MNKTDKKCKKDKTIVFNEPDSSKKNLASRRSKHNVKNDEMTYDILKIFQRESPSLRERVSISLIGNDESYVTVKDNKDNCSKRVQRCQSCKNENLLENHKEGTIVCTECGDVVSNIIDKSPEWHDFENINSGSGYTCFNPLLPQTSMSITINGYYKSPLVRQNNWISIPPKERSRMEIFNCIHDKCVKGNLYKCIEDEAKILYSQISECKHKTGKSIITRGDHRKGLIASCIYRACQRREVSKTIGEISELFGISKRKFNDGLKMFDKLIKISNLNKYISNVQSQPSKSIKYVCNTLSINKKYEKDALNILANVEKTNIISTHTPNTIASACLALMANNNKLKGITNDKIAKILCVSVNTIIKAYKKIYKYKHIVTDSDKTNTMMEDNKATDIPDEISKLMKEFDIDECG